MASRRVEDLETSLQIAWTRAKKIFAEKYPEDPEPILTATHRSNAEQNKTYAQGRTAPGKKVTNAKAGQSPHNFLPARAFDIAFLKSPTELDWDLTLFKKFADIIKEMTKDIEWGGDFKSIKDAPHFQLKNWNKK